MPRFPILWFFLPVLPAALHAQQPLERYTIDDDAVAVYNLVGAVRVEAGEGGVAVQVTRAGADAARLRVAQGEIDGRATLRVIYPEDRINPGSGRPGGSTTLRVREDGTFGDTDDEHDRHGRHDRGGWGEGRKVTIASGRCLERHA